MKHVPFAKFRQPTWLKPPLILAAVGSFNPPTYLHLRILEEAKIALSHKFDIIGAMISPAHDEYGLLHKKSLQSASIAHRIAMCNLATQSSNWIGVGTWEQSQKKWQRTAIVLSAYYDSLNDKDSPLFANYPKNNESNKNIPEKKINIRLVCGSDLLESFLVPNLWKIEHV